MRKLLLSLMILGSNSKYFQRQMSFHGRIYCFGDLLHDIQISALYRDSKTFVDKKLKNPVTEVLHKYDILKRKYNMKTPPSVELKKFVEENFTESTELKIWKPEDWQPFPEILNKIKEPKYKEWARNLNEVWMELSRKVIDDVWVNQNFYSMVYVPNGFVIPGGRFKEQYYWDSYWIVKGLLNCDMIHTAKGVIENFLWLIMLFGYVPTGNRVYYRHRSQPPLLTMMVDSYFEVTGDFGFITNCIKLLDKEMNYWVNHRAIQVDYDKGYKMFHYKAHFEGPRPESYREDIETASVVPTKTGRMKMYGNIKAAAESGWDFSSRWFINNGTNFGTMSHLSTSDIIPVDLNCILHHSFVLLKKWHHELGNLSKANQYTSLSNNLQEAIENVLWNEDEGTWFDYDVLNQKKRQYFYLSNLTPLWTKSYTFDIDILTKKMLLYMEKENFDSYDGGIPISTVFSGEQWDYPNAWAPLQSFLINGLDKIGTIRAKKEAFELANKWVFTNFIGYQKHKQMFEKYDVTRIGTTGVGGEYIAQTGFGWTNGVIFECFAKWGQELYIPS